MLIHDCIDKGMSTAAGGLATTHQPHDDRRGTVGDSLAAVKKLFFEEKRLSMKELRRALAVTLEERNP